MNEAPAPSPAADDWGLSDVPAVTPKVTLFRYMWCQPFLMAFFYVCAEKIRDPMYWLVHELVTTSVAFYIMAVLALPLWFVAHLYQRRTACSKRGLLTTPEGWLRLMIGTVPLIVIPALMMIGDHEKLTPGYLSHVGQVVLCALLASIVGTAHFIYGRVSPDACTSEVAERCHRRANRWLVVFVLLVFLGTQVCARVLLDIPDLPSSRRLLVQAVPAEIALKARNVHMFKQRGYLLASGDPVFLNFRFDTDAETVQALIKAVIEERKGFSYYEDVESRPWGPDWWRTGRARHYRVGNKQFWFDLERNRVYVAVPLRDL